MATVWGLVTASSTLPETNDFWDHLNNLGSGAGGFLTLLDGLEIEMDDRCVDVELDSTSVDVEVDFDEKTVEVETLKYDVEIC